MKYFLSSFSPVCWFKKGNCQFLVKECEKKVQVNHTEDKACPEKVWLGYRLDITLKVLTGPFNSNSNNYFSHVNWKSTLGEYYTNSDVKIRLWISSLNSIFVYNVQWFSIQDIPEGSDRSDAQTDLGCAVCRCLWTCFCMVYHIWLNWYH